MISTDWRTARLSWQRCGDVAQAARHSLAQQHGNQKLWVVNDSVNAAMLGLNAKLGFVRGGVNVRYLKVLV